MIECINIPRNANSIIAHDVIKNGKKTDMTLNDMIELIEFELLDIMDILVKDALRNCTSYYYVLGGKSLNNLYMPSIRGINSRSFDFDIHVHQNTDIVKLSKFIVDDTNTTLNQHWKVPFKYQIFRKLKKLNLIDNSNIDYYVNDKLFYYGTRQRRSDPIKISSVFIRFQFRPTLFSYKNINNYLYSNINKTYDLNKQYIKNDIYIPIIDIDTDDDLNIGVKVYKTGINVGNVGDPHNFQYSIYMSPIDKINYADLYVSTFNLIRLIAMGYKTDNNIKKFKNLFNFNNYSCDVLTTYDQQYSNLHINNIIPQITQNANTSLKADAVKYNTLANLNGKLIVNGNNYLDSKWKYLDILRDLHNKLDNEKKLKICDSIFSPNKPNTGIKYIFDGLNFTDSETFKNDLAFVAYNVDKKYEHMVFVYTTDDIYKNVNLYNIYINNGLDIDWTLNSWTSRINPTTQNKQFNTDTVNFSVNQSLLNNNDSYDRVCNLLDNSIIEYHKNLHLNNILFDKIPDDFDVITFQQISNFDLGGSGITNVTDLRVGDTILYPQYISTTFSTNTDLTAFAFYNRTILKIKLSKESASWMFVGPYSYVGHENEVFIGRNKYFLITDISTVVVYVKKTNIDYRLISLTLIDKPKEAINLSLTTKPDIVFKSPLFIYAANYAYDNHLSKPYNETNLSDVCPGLRFDWDSVMIINVDNNPKNIYRYNHGLVHSLRVASFIQLYGLIIKSTLRDVDNIYSMITTELLWKASIAAIFMVTGRESEASFVTACPALPYDKTQPYNRYLAASARNFVLFTQSIKDLNIFTEEDVVMFSDLINNYYNIYDLNDDLSDVKVLLAHLFTESHALDLIRCKSPDEYSVALPNSVINTDDVKIYLPMMTKIIIDVMDITGDRIMGSQIINKTYDKVKFYQCSTDPFYCIEEISTIISPRIEELLLELKIFDDLKNSKNLLDDNNEKYNESNRIKQFPARKENIFDEKPHRYFSLNENDDTVISNQRSFIRNDRLLDNVLKHNINLTRQKNKTSVIRRKNNTSKYISDENIDIDDLIEQSEAQNIGTRFFIPYKKTINELLLDTTNQDTRDNTDSISASKYSFKSVIPINTCIMLENDIIGRNNQCASKNMYAYAASVYETFLSHKGINKQIYIKQIDTSVVASSLKISNINDIIQSTEKRLVHENNMINTNNMINAKLIPQEPSLISTPINLRSIYTDKYKNDTSFIDNHITQKNNEIMVAGYTPLSNLQKYISSKRDYNSLIMMHNQ